MPKATSAILAAFTCVLFASALCAQDPAPPTKKAELVYEVVEIQGKVAVAPTGTDPKIKDGWSPVKVGDQLRAGQQLRVGMTRSKVKFVARPADPPTVMLIDRGSLVNISELAFENGAAKSRIQLNYGQIKAGVAEGSVRSDMQIESPVATLSKRGTDIFGMEYMNGQWKMYLTDQGRGMIQAIQTQLSAFGSQKLQQSRFVTPGQFVTQQLMRAIDNVQFDRSVNVNDVFGMGGSDSLFNLINDRGFGLFLNSKGSNQNLFGTTDPDSRVGDEDGVNPARLLAPIIGGTNRPRITAGDFGVGQGNLAKTLRANTKNRLARKLMQRTNPGRR